MSENLHQRAKQLIAQALVEGLDRAEQSWLDAHLRECGECSREAVRTRELVHSFRSLPVAVPHDLATRTQLRIRLRAQESAQASPSSAFLWVITAASWALGILSAPFVWRIFAWVGAEFSVPKLVLEVGFVLWWTVPALIAVAVVLYQRATGPARTW
jgi:anti-sigma factor RsiW